MEGWETKKLVDVCEVIAGQSPQSKYYNKEGKGLPFYQGKKEYGEKYIGEPTTWTTKITKEVKFCSVCGYELLKQKEKCPNCNKLVNKGDMFCKHCGAKIGG